MIFENIYPAKAKLSGLINKALAGEDVYLTKNGVPVVELKPVTKLKGKRVPGGWEGKVKIFPGFDEVDEEIVKMFEGEYEPQNE